MHRHYGHQDLFDVSGYRCMLVQEVVHIARHTDYDEGHGNRVVGQHLNGVRDQPSQLFILDSVEFVYDNDGCPLYKPKEATNDVRASVLGQEVSQVWVRRRFLPYWCLQLLELNIDLFGDFGPQGLECVTGVAVNPRRKVANFWAHAVDDLVDDVSKGCLSDPSSTEQDHVPAGLSDGPDHLGYLRFTARKE